MAMRVRVTISELPSRGGMVMTMVWSSVVSSKPWAAADMPSSNSRERSSIWAEARPATARRRRAQMNVRVLDMATSLRQATYGHAGVPRVHEDEFVGGALEVDAAAVEAPRRTRQGL